MARPTLLLAAASAAALMGVASAGFCDGRSGYYCVSQYGKVSVSTGGAGTISKYCRCKYKTKCEKKKKCKTKRDCDTAFETTCRLGCGAGHCKTADKVCGTTWRSPSGSPPQCPIGGSFASFTSTSRLPSGWKSFKNVMDSSTTITQRGYVVQARRAWFSSLLNNELMSTTISCTNYTACSGECTPKTSALKSFVPNETAAIRAGRCANSSNNVSVLNPKTALPLPLATQDVVFRAACENASLPLNSTCQFTVAVAINKPPQTSAGVTLTSLYSKAAPTYARFACEVSYPRCIGSGTASFIDCIRDCQATTDAISSYEQGCKSAHAAAMMEQGMDATKVGFECKTLVTIDSANRCGGTAGGKAGVWCVEGQGTGFTPGGWKRDCNYICTGNEPAPPPAPPGPKHSSSVVGLIVVLLLIVVGVAVCFFMKCLCFAKGGHGGSMKVSLHTGGHSSSDSD